MLDDRCDVDNLKLTARLQNLNSLQNVKLDYGLKPLCKLRNLHNIKKTLTHVSMSTCKI